MVVGGVVSLEPPEIFTVQLLATSTLPATSVERYCTVWVPGAETVSVAPVVQAPASSLHSVFATPEPPVSVAVKVRVTGSACQASSAPETVVVGGVVSVELAETFTVHVFAISTLPALSVER